ncbi:MAG: class I SAM-dependent methyltransferase [Candidatus Fermentibacteraceae bacterium]
MEPPFREWFADQEYWEANRGFIWSEKRVEMSFDAAESIARLLEMKPGASVLDLACGFGRHALALSALGYRVTGVDLNPAFIAEASRKALDESPGARFLCADMREFRERDGFDNIMIAYNSFGYFRDPGDDEKVIENCFHSLKPGGKLLLQSVTREWLMAQRPERYFRYWHEEGEGRFRLEETEANEDWTWNSTRWIVLCGASRREYRYGMRIYSTEEYLELLGSKGFGGFQTYGGFGGRPYEKGKDHLTLVAVKPVETP